MKPPYQTESGVGATGMNPAQLNNEVSSIAHQISSLGMDILSAHIVRQREQSTWVFTNQTSKQNIHQLCAYKKQSVYVRQHRAATSNHAPDVTSAPSCCCCQTLQNAFVTIDILRTKLVSLGKTAFSSVRISHRFRHV